MKVLDMSDEPRSGTKVSFTINTPPFVLELPFLHKSCPQIISNLGHLPVKLMDVNEP